MIWTGESGQLATTYMLILVPGGVWQSTAMVLTQQGFTPALALVAATIGTAGWLAVVLTPAVRRMVIRAIFVDERPEREKWRDGPDLRELFRERDAS